MVSSRHLPLVTTLGGLLSGLIVFGLAPEAEGHGTDAAIAAIHHNGGRVRARIPPIKLVASAITIGSGGSAGREGPTAQISAGFGSLLAGWLGLDLADRCSRRESPRRHRWWAGRCRRRLTRDALVVSITRDAETLFPRASTRIEAGDVLMVTTQRANEAPVRAFLEGSPPAPS
jgi:Voltage gated chloride channel/TrkA-C domain